MIISTAEALSQLNKEGQLFLTLFTHGTLEVEMYKPGKTDLQQPHERDEVYVVIAGSGEFINGNVTSKFNTGDFIFVKAGTDHRFFNYTRDFATWVIFYGPKGGEK